MLFYSIIALILSSAVNSRRDIAILYNRISILVLLFAFFFFFNVFYFNYINSGIIILNGLLCIENYIIIFSMVIIIISMLILAITSVFYLKINNDTSSTKDSNKINWNNSVFFDSMSEHYRLIEYPLIVMFCIIGTIFLMLSFDIISIFLSLELQSYALYLICCIYRNSESSTYAGLTYFLLGSLSSCIILLGLALLYVNTGNTNLENLCVLNNISDIFYYSMLYNNNNFLNTYNLLNSNIFIFNLISSINTQYIFLQISMLLISVGLLFKIGSAPFHFWSPDVYDGVPTITTTFIAIVPKISILIFLYKMLYYTSSNIVILSWVNNIILSSILSLIFGSILGLTQFRIKRLYAYSTISHLGFILIALSINNVESSKAFLFYLLQYSLSNLNAFIILIIVGYTLKIYIINKEKYNTIKIKDINFSPVQLISQLKGYYKINPVLSISLCLTLFSFAGIPPLVGFFGKQMILSAALNTNLFFIVIISIVCSVISSAYYLIIIKVMCFENNNYKLNNRLNNNINKYYISSFYSLTVSCITLMVIFFSFFEQDILKIFLCTPY